jgi:hypothetical protein
MSHLSLNFFFRPVRQPGKTAVVRASLVRNYWFITPVYRLSQTKPSVSGSGIPRDNLDSASEPYIGATFPQTG